MANTLKFGNENWATKKDSILAYNDENANFKPLPFTTSRASTATRVNKAGLLETVASGIPRVDYLGNTKGAYLLEPQSTNLIARSEDFSNSYWTKSGASIQGDVSTAGSDVLSGFNFTNWSAIGGASIVDSDTFNSTSSGGIRKDGLITSGKTYLITIAGTTEATSFTVRNYGLGITYKTITSGAFNETFYIEAEDAGFYLRNNGAYTTNVTTLSVKEVSGFSSPSADTPLGAFKLVEDTSTARHEILVSSSNSGDLSLSVFAKKGERSVIQFSNAQDPSLFCNFDLDLGVVGSSLNITSSNIIDIGNGWYRCNVSYNASLSINSSRISIVTSATSVRTESYTGDGTSGVYIFGAQVEQKSYATSYIPTAGSAITRLADTASQTLPDGVIGQTEGTVFLDTVINTDVNGLTRISLSQDVSTSNWIFFSAPEVSGGLVRTRIIIYNGGNLQVNLYGGVLTSGRHKFALAYKENDVVLYVDGVLDLSDNSALIPSTNKISLIGSSPASDNADRFNKHSDFKLYNTRLSNSELQALTKV